MNARTVDRRGSNRNPLYLARRRYPRVRMQCDVFYEGLERATFAREAELSLRGLLLPCAVPDAVGARGRVRIDTGEGELIQIEVQVARHATGPRRGMVLRFVGMDDLARIRLGELLVGRGGLAALPQLDRRFSALTRTARLVSHAP